jgi:hypothetical protein
VLIFFHYELCYNPKRPLGYILLKNSDLLFAYYVKSIISGKIRDYVFSSAAACFLKCFCKYVGTGTVGIFSDAMV